MVCKKCEKKLSKVAAPDPFTSSSSSIKDGSRKVGENKLLSRPGSSKNRFQPYQGKCKDCKQPCTQNQAKYCHGCAYKKGLCTNDILLCRFIYCILVLYDGLGWSISLTLNYCAISNRRSRMVSTL
ncbi:postsynaptic protein cript [Lentinula edodes]|uniref:Cysteine-rich PDZ-binding protein n=1 Tax=Lentinula edodes TaxID=5353 RepID=A0A1Q3DZR2_LENED|nr:postsynaptic protein cript [Lentinula edodes]